MPGCQVGGGARRQQGGALNVRERCTARATASMTATLRDGEELAARYRF
jgi:hypothetical protein